MKKIVALVLSMMLLIALLPSVVAVAADKRIVKVASWDVYGSAANYHEAIKAGYEAANPDVEIEWVDLASQEYATLAGSMLAAGDQTDVFIVKEIKDLQNWTAAGLPGIAGRYGCRRFVRPDRLCRHG